MNSHRRTFVAKPEETQAQRGWWVVDATDMPLGRLATAIADRLRGKHKPTFTPHVDTGDFVIVVNATKVKLTGRKPEQKQHYWHTNHPGSIKNRAYSDLIAKDPETPIRLAVWGMIPKSPLGRKIIKKLKVYGGPDHPHTAQNPQVLQPQQ